MNYFETILTRQNLLDELHKSWNDLQSFLASLTEQQLTVPTDVGGWTVKDHIIHLATWEEAGMALFEGKSKREALDIDPDTWEQGEDPINAVIHGRYQDMKLDEVLNTFQQVHDNTLKKLDTMTQEDLQRHYRHFQPNSRDKRPILRWVIIATVDHYAEHMPWLKAIVEE
jgi:hypothetical protein